MQLLDQPDIVQPLEGTLERRRIARPAGQGHAREQAEHRDRDGRGLGELPGHPEDKASRFIAWPHVSHWVFKVAATAAAWIGWKLTAARLATSESSVGQYSSPSRLR